MLRILLLIFLIKYSILCHSQTIINAERLHSFEDSLQFALALNYNGTRGNAVTDQYSISPVIAKISRKNAYKIFGGYNALSQRNSSILNSGFVHLRHNYKINERLKTFEFYQIQYNEVLLLNKREAFGAGLRYSFFKKDSLRLDLGLGAMRENEFLNKSQIGINEISDTRFIRATSVGSFECILKSLQIDNVFYFQPRLSDINDFRFLNDLNLSFSITKHIKFITTLISRYDSKPPTTLKPVDHSIRFGLNLVY